jgi:hypothetical protein
MSRLPAASYDGVLERTAVGGVIRFGRRLPYAIGDVWDAITNPSRLAQSWLPFDAHITLGLASGATMVLTPRDGGSDAIVCRILRVEPPTLFEHVHLDGASNLHWDLEAMDSGCILRLRHFVLDPAGTI